MREAGDGEQALSRLLAAGELSGTRFHLRLMPGCPRRNVVAHGAFPFDPEEITCVEDKARVFFCPTCQWIWAEVPSDVTGR